MNFKKFKISSYIYNITSIFYKQSFKGWGRKKATLVTAGAVFLFGIPSALSGSGMLFPEWQSMYGKNFFDTFDYLASNWMLPLGGLFISIYVGWSMDPALRRSEFETGGGWSNTWYYKTWLFFLKFIAPLAVIAVILQRIGIIDFDILMK